MNIRETPPRIAELEKISTRTDTRDYLAKAASTTETLKDWLIVDVDAHVNEAAFLTEVNELIDNDVMRYIADSFRERPGAPPGLLYANGPLLQDVGGRVMHHQALMEPTPPGLHRQVQLSGRAMDAMGIDYQVVFPNPMLSLGMHPQVEAEVTMARAYNRWLTEKILPQDPRQMALLYLPFNDPDASVETVEEFSGKPGVVGFTVTATRNKPVWHNSYMRLYAALQDHNMPLGFHANFSWSDPSFRQLNRFIGMHALSFVHFNMIHLTNWVLNGLPERFPKLKVIWIESGVAWVPFIMQRLDSEYMMRTSECPLLKRRPSEYIQEMYFSSQPLERTNMKLLQATFEAINADTQLLYSSDWPHWDFDVPSSIARLPFLDERAKRNILGLNAAKLFNLNVPAHKSGVKRPAPVPEPAR
jgi:predicted TIM-barrel fold metal-dependent hydrolase